MWKSVEVQHWTPLEVILNEFCLRITLRCMQRSRKRVLPHWIRLYLPPLGWSADYAGPHEGEKCCSPVSLFKIVTYQKITARPKTKTKQNKTKQTKKNNNNNNNNNNKKKKQKQNRTNKNKQKQKQNKQDMTVPFARARAKLGGSIR